MSEHAVMPMAHYEATCDTIQEKTGAESNHIKSGELPTKINEVYEKGKQDGVDEFWDKFQNNGGLQDYNYAFCSTAWTMELYKPKYPIRASYSNMLFAYNTNITDTLVEIDVSSSTSNRTQMFNGASKLETIRMLKVLSGMSYSNMFTGCSKLKNITFEGEIGRSISFQSSPLTPESMRSVIEHLVNYAGTSNDGKYTVTFTDACWGALEADLDYPAPEDGMTWREYVDVILGWNT